MAWCPLCKCEYVDGITVCADCGCELVEKLEEGPEKELAEEAEEESEEKAVIDEEEIKQRIYKGRYVSNEEKAQENKTSAYTLLIVGCVGLLVITLFFLDLLPLHRIIMNKYMITGVMGTLFILFIIMGCVSLRNSKILAGKASKENNLTLEIRKWCNDNISEAGIDGELVFSEDITEELKYFERCEKMKNMIKMQFMNLDEGYLDSLIDEIYPEIFEDVQE